MIVQREDGGFEVWADGSKTREANLVLVFNKWNRIDHYRVPIDRILGWDAHPVRKIKSKNISSCFSKSSGLVPGYQSNPYICVLDMLYSGGDGDEAVRKALMKIDREFTKGALLLATNVTYSRGLKSLKFKINYHFKDIHFGADWSAFSKVVGSQGSTGNIAVYHVVRVDLSKNTVAEGKYMQPTAKMADLCLKDKHGNWLPIVHNLTEKEWEDKEALKRKYGNLFITLTIPPIRYEIIEFYKEQLNEWKTTKLLTNKTWTLEDKRAFLKSTADGIYIAFSLFFCNFLILNFLISFSFFFL